jgi:hypothetical protein
VDGDSCFLLEMDGMLAMGDFHILRFVDVWVLQDYDDDESWTLRLRVHLPQQLLGSCLGDQHPRGRTECDSLGKPYEVMGGIIRCGGEEGVEANTACYVG